jgi:hypothetical protein
MSLFRDSCVELEDSYEVRWDFCDEMVNRNNVEQIYTFIQNLRKLPKKFSIIVDMRRLNLLSLVPHVPKIIKETKGSGEAPCLRCTLIVCDKNVVLNFAAPIIASFSSSTNIDVVHGDNVD